RILFLDRVADLAALAAHEAQATSRMRRTGKEQVVEGVGVVEGHEAGHLLEIRGREFDAGRGLDAEGLLAASHQALLETRDDALASVQTQEARTRAEAGHGSVDRYARRLPERCERRVIEIVARRGLSPGLDGQVRRPGVARGFASALCQPWAAIDPGDALQRGLASEER